MSRIIKKRKIKRTFVKIEIETFKIDDAYYLN